MVVRLKRSPCKEPLRARSRANGLMSMTVGSSPAFLSPATVCVTVSRRAAAITTSTSPPSATSPGLSRTKWSMATSSSGKGM